MTKVDIILPSAGGGGAEMHAVRLANGLDRVRFRVRLVLFRGGGGYESAIQSHIERIVLTPGWVRSSLVSCVAAVGPLKQLWRESPPDVVLSFLSHTHAVVSRALGACPKRPRVVLGVQNNVDQERRKTSLGRRLAFPGEPDRAFSRADRVVALSNGVGRNFATHYPNEAARMTVIYNIGCEPEMSERAVEPLGRERPAEGYLLVACGRLEEQKDYLTMLRALAAVRADRPVTLWILGRGKLEADLRREAALLGIADRVEFLGFQTNPFKFMAAADVFLLSSRWEGFGNVIVEAMASGAPVVSTDCPFGPGEILRGGEFGSLVPVGDPDELAGEISALLANPAERTRLSAAGRERARDFLPDKVVPEYEAVLVGEKLKTEKLKS